MLLPDPGVTTVPRPAWPTAVFVQGATRNSWSAAQPPCHGERQGKGREPATPVIASAVPSARDCSTAARSGGKSIPARRAPGARAPESARQLLFSPACGYRQWKAGRMPGVELAVDLEDVSAYQNFLMAAVTLPGSLWGYTIYSVWPAMITNSHTHTYNISPRYSFTGPAGVTGPGSRNGLHHLSQSAALLTQFSSQEAGRGSFPWPRASVPCRAAGARPGVRGEARG